MDTNTPSDPRPFDRYRALFENSRDPILIIEDEIFIDCNQAAVDFLGYPNRQSLLQCHPSDLSPEYQSDGKRSYHKANQIMADIISSHSLLFEWDHLKADGSIVTVEVSLTLIPSGPGNIPASTPQEIGTHWPTSAPVSGYTLHAMWRDMSERKRLEKELRHSHKKQVLDNLVGGIAHDFNNTLVPIVIYSDLLANSLKQQPALLDWAQEIGRAAMLASNMVKKLSAVSRQDVRRPVILNLGDTIASSLGMLRKLIGEDIEVHFHQSDGPLWIETDPGDIDQTLLNLASNARDALPAGGHIHLTLSTIRQSGGNFARLTFTDNGIGMDAETLEQIFDPFFTTKPLDSGTGLGMSSVRELVKKAQGVVNATSSLGKGTTIEVLLPITESHHSKPSHLADEKSVSPVNGPAATETETILIVEDDDQIRRLIHNLLSQNGYRVYSANNGLKALATIKEVNPGLILADVVMPQMSGPKMIRKMHETGVHIPVIFLSGYTEDRLTAHGFDPQRVVLIRKPFTAGTLLKQVAQVLAANRQDISKP